MSSPMVADRSPVEITLEEGNEYWWCRCGRSRSQPFCDGSHEGTGIEPLRFVPERSRAYWLCRCKHTRKGPHCDGSHKNLPGTE